MQVFVLPERGATDLGAIAVSHESGGAGTRWEVQQRRSAERMIIRIPEPSDKETSKERNVERGSPSHTGIVRQIGLVNSGGVVECLDVHEWFCERPLNRSNVDQFRL